MTENGKVHIHSTPIQSETLQGDLPPGCMTGVTSAFRFIGPKYSEFNKGEQFFTPMLFQIGGSGGHDSTAARKALSPWTIPSTCSVGTATSPRKLPPKD